MDHIERKTIREKLEADLLTIVIEEFGRVKNFFTFEKLALLVKGKYASKILKAISTIEPERTGIDGDSEAFYRPDIALALKNICEDTNELLECEKYLLTLRGNGQGSWVFNKYLDALGDVEFKDYKRKIAQSLEKSLKSPEEVKHSINEALDRFTNSICTSSEVAPDRIDKVIDILKGKKTNNFTLSTGGRKLDAALGGGFKSGQLITVAAQPGTGKTSFVLNFLNHGLDLFRSGSSAAIFTLEISKEEIACNLITLKAGLERNWGRVNYFEENEAAPKDARDRLEKAEDILRGAEIHIFDKSYASLIQMVPRLRTLKREENLKLVIIDYLQLMEPDNDNADGDNITRRLSNITRQLKKLSLDLNICIVCLSQLNRNVDSRNRSKKEEEGAMPILSDLKGSGSIEQDSDVVIFLYEEGDKTNLKIAKNRRGKTCEISYKFDKDRGTFKEV